jgi:hypothetical protein
MEPLPQEEGELLRLRVRRSLYCQYLQSLSAHGHREPQTKGRRGFSGGLFYSGLCVKSFCNHFPVKVFEECLHVLFLLAWRIIEHV